MKKVIGLLTLFTIISFTPPKELTVTLTLDQWQKVLNVIDDARDHQAIKEVQLFIVPQLQKQLTDTLPKKNK